MATPAINIFIDERPENVRFNQTGCYVSFAQDYSTVSNIHTSMLNKRFIRLYTAASNQFKEIYGTSPKLNIKETFERSIDKVIKTHPDAISIELTSEKSLFFTVKKEEYTFFLQYYYEDVEEDDDEAIMTIYKNQEKQPSYAGKLDNTVSKIKQIPTYNSPKNQW